MKHNENDMRAYVHMCVWVYTCVCVSEGSQPAWSLLLLLLLLVVSPLRDRYRRGGETEYIIQHPSELTELSD